MPQDVVFCSVCGRRAYRGLPRITRVHSPNPALDTPQRASKLFRDTVAEHGYSYIYFLQRCNAKSIKWRTLYNCTLTRRCHMVAQSVGLYLKFSKRTQLARGSAQSRYKMPFPAFLGRSIQNSNTLYKAGLYTAGGLFPGGPPANIWFVHCSPVTISPFCLEFSSPYSNLHCHNTYRPCEGPISGNIFLTSVICRSSEARPMRNIQLLTPRYSDASPAGLSIWASLPTRINNCVFVSASCFHTRVYGMTAFKQNNK